MNPFKIIVQKEKDLPYTQRNKDLLSFYILTLIEQEQAFRQFRRNLLGFLLFNVTGIAFLLYPSTGALHYIVAHAAKLDLATILEVAAVSYGFLFALITLLMEQSPTDLN
jgi:hypothetical protein